MSFSLGTSESILSYVALSKRTRLESFSFTLPLLHFCEASRARWSQLRWQARGCGGPAVSAAARGPVDHAGAARGPARHDAVAPWPPPQTAGAVSAAQTAGGHAVWPVQSRGAGLRGAQLAFFLALPPPPPLFAGAFFLSSFLGGIAYAGASLSVDSWPAQSLVCHVAVLGELGARHVAPQCGRGGRPHCQRARTRDDGYLPGRRVGGGPRHARRAHARNGGADQGRCRHGGRR